MGAKELTKYQERAISSLKVLSGDKLKLVTDFIEYLKDREEWEATFEVLANEKMMADIKAAEEDWKAEKKQKFISWSKVKRSVSRATKTHQKLGDRTGRGVNKAIEGLRISF